MESKDNNNTEEEKTSPVTTSAAEEKKILGNKAFIAKDFDEAIARYSEAIELDPQNHIYYSNRSACYGSKGDWEHAAADAKTCIEKDPEFLKGYYRLTLAQIELKEYDDAINTIKSGLKKQPDNPELQKQLRVAKAKKNAAESARHSGGGSDARVSGEEIQEVQEQYLHAVKEIKEVRTRTAMVKADIRKTELTQAEISKVSEDTRLFRSLGKMFLLTPRPSVEKHLVEHLQDQNSKSNDLEARYSYLEAKISSHESMLKEARMASSRGS